MKLLYDKDASLDVLQGKTIAIIGYGSQAEAQSACLRDSGVNVIIGLREDGASWNKALAAGYKVMPIAEAVKQGDIVHILIPDEVQGDVFTAEIGPHLAAGKTLSFSHGFAIVFDQVKAPEGVDVIMVAPKSPGTEVRRTFEEGFGVPGLVAVEQDLSGKALQVALAMAKAEGLTRAGVFETSFADEAKEDLFGEQAVLCGGLVYLMKAGFEVLTEAGYAPEIAYFETVHEIKLIVDLIYKGGVDLMSQVVSNTAEWGMYETGPRVIGPEVKERMKKVLEEIDNGTFAKNWIQEVKNGSKVLKQKREELKAHEVEKTGQAIRKLFQTKK
ncbi:MAG: ketol-acid reductoisomerase [Spirochaetales bacterium]|nr:ketol-acid reductoisomerase [Spirochaetales bacterium]